MIRFVVAARNRDSILKFLASSGRGLEDLVEPVAWESVLRGRALPPATYVLTDFDRMSAPVRASAGALHDALSRSTDAGVLNDPRRWEDRFTMLDRLHATGANPFGVHRGDVDPRAVRFPAFVRFGSDHHGPRGGLVADASALEAALAPLRRKSRRSPADIMIVEQVDAPDQDGRYRKYGAFRVGDRVVARHLFFGPSWLVKAPHILVPETLDEEHAYVRDNPHAETLLDVFEAAGVEYGRIDYGFVDGSLCVYEINTSPMISIPEDDLPGIRVESERIFTERFTEALRAVDTESSGAATSLPRFRIPLAERLAMGWRRRRLDT